MNHRLITITLCTLFLIGAAALAADELALYENVEKGFSISYPKEWEKKEDGAKGVELYSSKEFASNYEKGGAMVGVYCYTITEPITPERAIKELLVVGDDFPLEKISQKKLAGQSWSYTQATNKKEDIKAEFFVFIIKNTVYIIACGYKPTKVSTQFTPVVTAILDSFQFITEASGSQGTFAQYENKKIGVSFSYPAGWKLEEYGNNVTVASNPDFILSEGKGAGFAIFYGTAENVSLSETPKTVEELWEKLKAEEGGFKEISKTYKEWQENKWLFVEFLSTKDNLKAYFYLRLDEGKIYMVGYIYHPPETENTYKTIIDEIHSSIRFFPPAAE